MTSGETVSSGCKTRSRDKAFDADRDFAPSKDFQSSTKLPTIKSVLGMLRYHLEREGKGTVTNAMALREVAKQVYAKFFHVTVFCVSVSTIERRVEKLKKTFSVGRMMYGESGKEESKPVKELVQGTFYKAK